MNSEFLAVVEHMEKERGIDREKLLATVESALLRASSKNEDEFNGLRVEIDRSSFEIKTYTTKTVVDKISNENLQIEGYDARKVNPDAKEGDEIEVEVSADDLGLGRIGAQTAKQAIMHSIRQAEKERVVEEYSDRVGDIVNGTVRRFDRNDVVIDLGQAEAVLPSRERVPTEEYQIGERIRAFVLKVNTQGSGPEVVLSRSHPDFVRRLFEIEVTEISDGTVEIRGIAREAGYRSKVSVISADEKVDPVGACVGMRGIRVKNIVRELGGEKIDIVRHHDDIKTYVTNALAPAKLSNISVDEDAHTVIVTVEGDQLSLAIGKKGQNARLTAKLTGWKIDIQKDEGDMDFGEKVALAITNLKKIEGVEDAEAEALVQSGFLTIEGLLAAETEDLEFIEGFDLAKAREVKRAAEAYYDRGHGKVEI